MNTFYGRKGLKKSVAIAVMCLFLLTGTVCTYAATEALAKGYNTLWYNTSVAGQEKLELPDTEQDYVVHEGTLADLEDYSVIEGESNAMMRSLTGIEVDLGNYSYYRSAEIKKSKTGSIKVQVSVEPTNRTISVGIIRPDTTTTYVEGKDMISYKFTNLNMSGKFRVFIANRSGAKVHVSGHYE